MGVRRKRLNWVVLECTPSLLGSSLADYMWLHSRLTCILCPPLPCPFQKIHPPKPRPSRHRRHRLQSRTRRRWQSCPPQRDGWVSLKLLSGDAPGAYMQYPSLLALIRSSSPRAECSLPSQPFPRRRCPARDARAQRHAHGIARPQDGTHHPRLVARLVGIARLRLLVLLVSPLPPHRLSSNGSCRGSHRHDR